MTGDSATDAAPSVCVGPWEAATRAIGHSVHASMLHRPAHRVAAVPIILSGMCRGRSKRHSHTTAPRRPAWGDAPPAREREPRTRVLPAPCDCRHGPQRQEWAVVRDIAVPAYRHRRLPSPAIRRLRLLMPTDALIMHPNPSRGLATITPGVQSRVVLATLQVDTMAWHHRTAPFGRGRAADLMTDRRPPRDSPPRAAATPPGCTDASAPCPRPRTKAR